MAQRFKAKVILLGVVSPLVIGQEAVYPIFDEENYKQQIEQMKAYLTARKEGLQAKGVEAQVRVGYRYIVDEIIDTAEQENVDLIAMTSHGRTGLSHVFYGSVAAGVLHRIDRPLLLIRSMTVD